MNQYVLVNWRRFLTRPYRTCSIGDVYAAIDTMKSARSQKGTPFAQNTKHDYVKVLKPFLLWLIENEYSSLPKKKVQKIKRPPKNYQTTAPEEILTTDEIRMMLAACRNSRDRALIATLYDSGCRCGELARLQWRDVRFDDYGCGIYVNDTKTRKTRYNRLGAATQYLATWKSDYPGHPEGEQLVFLTVKKKPMEYDAISRIVHRTADRAEIPKRVHPHLFRKSRITHLIQQNCQESVIKEAMWGNLNTEMFQTYVVLSERDIDSEMLNVMGVKQKPRKQENAMAPRQCPKCYTINGPLSNYCTVCGRALNPEAEATMGELKRDIKDHPEAMQMMLNTTQRENGGGEES